MILYDTMPSPVGQLLLVSEDDGLTGLYFETCRYGRRAADDWTRAPGCQALGIARAQLDAYFAGSLSTFTLPLAPRGTAFQQRVWAELRSIGCGETISYGELARRIGDPRAVRAVAGANARNPIAIIVPCHRVIGADGSLTGFGGGLERKRWLLEHESGTSYADGPQLALEAVR
ncbi:MAG: methylated-DNA--[protein]-cysteine S-methyltransferase [Gemmatimonadales bacterium]